ncbi:MAG TPA: hypothetical protein DCZ94_12795 [Lentisphaeria bacterium]|nr:MAG: hypothetical protein A2X48_11015 [Lentisphaerae bacterium GWF2_49_21]HBC87825.1 hypothetical protein [Lentisphaeria bacterium]
MKIGNRKLKIGNRFTLIELLVVIGIIFVLIGILLPAIYIAKKKSKGTLCMANMKQIAVGFTMYADDYAGTMVAGRMPSGVYDVGNGMKFKPRWYAQIGVSAKFYAFSNPDPLAAGDNTQRVDNKIFICPQADPTTSLDRDNGRNYSYGYNFQFLGNSRLNSSTSKYISFPRKISSVRNLDSTVVFADCMGTAAGKATSARQPYDAVLQGGTANGDSKIGNHAWALDPPRLVAGSSDYCNDSSRNPASRSAPYAVHSKLANIAFLDGHVDTLSLLDLGYIVKSDGAVDVNGHNKMFSGTANDDDPPAIN